MTTTTAPAIGDSIAYTDPTTDTTMAGIVTYVHESPVATIAFVAVPNQSDPAMCNVSEWDWSRLPA